MKENKQHQVDKVHTMVEPEQTAGVGYFMEKFHVSAEDVAHAIEKAGNSSEALEQYFTEQRRNAPF
jgi:predicted phosphoribosyltransferase